MANELCLYCNEDFDGYVKMLPREGIGNAYIHRSTFDGWTLNFSGKYHTKAKIKINFCPMCGRKLKVGAEDGNALMKKDCRGCVREFRRDCDHECTHCSRAYEDRYRMCELSSYRERKDNDL